MKTKTFEVKSKRGRKGPDAKREPVGSVAVEQFETLGEAVATLGSEERVVELVNTQYATNAKNKLRASVNQKLSETKLRNLATAKIISDTDLLGRLVAEAKANGTTPKAAIDKAIEAEADRLRAELASAPAAGSADAEEEDEE